MKLKQRLFSLLLCAALLVSLCAPAAAEDTGKYLTWDETKEKLVEANIPDPITDVKDETPQLDDNTTSGWYIVRFPNVKINNRLTVSGDVHLILANGCALTVAGGIDVSEGNSLTIYAQSTDERAMGKLTATGSDYDAGIGGGNGGDGGKITINGGNVTAEGDIDAAGIGGGISGAGGTITISGGVVTATGYNGAGIGGGLYDAGGKITISGGEVTATSCSDAAGIGGGGTGWSGEITISGGTVRATSEGDGAGIGGGGGNYEKGGTITITGGKVTAASNDDGAGIGGGAGGDGGTITISDGTVKASSAGNGAGIGGGIAGDGGEITISGNAKVEATSEGGGAGIGGGAGGKGDQITISGNAKVEATSEGFGAGIGGGEGDAGGTITINGGEVSAKSSIGAGIGGGEFGDGGQITISGGTVTASSTSRGAGIGSGSFGGGGQIIINGGTVTASSTSTGAGIGGGEGDAGGTITINGGTVTATSAYGGAGIGGGMNGESGTFAAGGNAFIVASSIKDNGTEKKKQWSGVIFEGNSGSVYGSEITLAADAEILTGTTLEIEGGQTLIVGEDVTLTNNGEIANSGTIINNGKIINSGTISGAGIIVNNGTITGNEITGNTVHEAAPDAGWQHDGSGHWHECAVEGCTAHKFDTAAHTPGGWIVDQAATSTEAGQRHRECTVCGYVTATETIPATGGGDGDGGGDSYTPPTYKPEVSKPGEGGGTPSISPSKPEKGDTVTVTPKPDDGYEVDKITVTDRNGKPVEVTKKPDGAYTFTQPSSKVTIEVTYRPIDRPWNNPFTDVSEGDWYYEAVRFVHERGLMNGYEDGRFGPNDTLSRAQLAQILFNKEGRPGVNYLLTFPDVTGEAWYTEAIRWAASQGIVGGYGNGRFGPNDNITREQLAVMLWRYSGSPAAASKELHFNDTDEISGFALEALRWAVENGILNGYGDGRLGPQGQATRAQVAQMLKNFIENQEDDEIQ